MENQNPNFQDVQNIIIGQSSQLEQQSLQQKANNPNPNSQNQDNQLEQSKPNNHDKKINYAKNQNHERNHQNERNVKYSQKQKERKHHERTKEGQFIKQCMDINNQGRYARKGSHNINQGETIVKNVKPSRTETVEDILADIERIEKDIQFEIKQIRTIKLGL